MGNSVEKSTLELELSSEEAVDALRQLSHVVSINDNITSVIVEIEANGVVTLDKYTEELFETPQSAIVGDGEEVIDFNIDSDAYKTAACLYEAEDKWHTTSEIKNELIKDVDVDKNRISQILWDLCQRGILEKREYENDRRMREYRVSETGKKSVELKKEELEGSTVD